MTSENRTSDTNSDPTIPNGTETNDLTSEDGSDGDPKKKKKSKKSERHSFDLHRAFVNKQTALDASFTAIRNVTSHPGAKGDQLEADWVGLIRDFLPTRYEVGPIFAVDHTGAMSEQIDVAVYDKHFSPQWFGGANGLRFVPVESVYAVFEVKPEFNAKYVKYAIKKVASVRRLERTSEAVVHKGGKYNTSEITLNPILGGILTTRNKWPTNPMTHFDKYQPSNRDDNGFLNIGIALDAFCFDYTATSRGDSVTVERTISQPDQQLIHFAIRLFRQLQAAGGVPAVDMGRYEEAIHKFGAADLAATQKTDPTD